MKKIKLVIKDIVILMSTFLLMLLLTYLFYPIVKKNIKFEPAIETLIYLIISLYLFIIYRKEIINSVWKTNVSNRTVDTTISRLRKKLGDSEKYLVTKLGFGYGFVDY